MKLKKAELEALVKELAKELHYAINTDWDRSPDSAADEAKVLIKKVEDNFKIKIGKTY